MNTSPDPLELYLNSVGSKETKRQYRRRLEDFLCFIGIEGKELSDKARNYVEKASMDSQWAFSSVLSYLSHQRDRYDRKEIVAGTLRNTCKPIKSFYEMNDLQINWRRLTRGLPKSRQFGLDRAPTTEEIRKLIQYPDRRMKPLILVMSSCGMRVGAWDFLKWGHIQPISRNNEIIAAKIIIYAGEPEQYMSFITPEAYHAAKEWMDFRAEHGEQIGPQSWVMRNLFKAVTLKYGTTRGMAAAPKQMKSTGIRNMIKRAWIAQGVIKNIDSANSEFKNSHGFRKRFKTQCELAGLKPLNVECLLGHDTGVNGTAYYRPTDEELLQDYIKAIPALQLSEVAEAREKFTQKEKAYRDEHQSLQQQIAVLQSQVAALVSEGLFARHAAVQSSHPSPSDK